MKITIKQLKQIIKEQVEEVKQKNTDVGLEPIDRSTEPTWSLSLEEMLDNLLKAADAEVVVGGSGPGDPHKERMARLRKVEKIKKDILRYYGDHEV